MKKKMEELCQIHERIKSRGTGLLFSENERLAQIYCQILNDNDGVIPEEYQKKFDKIFDIMLEYS